jgi:CRP/FNR family cyclic AMP-dependent transcriptional regulator
MTPTVDGSIGESRYLPPPASQDFVWTRRVLGKGEALFRCGDAGDSVYRVEVGLLKLVMDGPNGKERILALAGPGDLLGTLRPSGAAHQETAEALSDQVFVVSLEREQFGAHYAGELLQAAADRLEWMREVLQEVDLPVSARVARALLRLGGRFGHRADDGSVWLTLPLTHEDLGALVGAARETTSSALGQIRRAGALKGTRGRYRFDAARLESFTHPEP